MIPAPGAFDKLYQRNIKSTDCRETTKWYTALSETNPAAGLGLGDRRQRLEFQRRCCKDLLSVLLLTFRSRDARWIYLHLSSCGTWYGAAIITPYFWIPSRKPRHRRQIALWNDRLQVSGMNLHVDETSQHMSKLATPLGWESRQQLPRHL